MASTRKKVLLPHQLAKAGYELAAQRTDIEAIPFQWDMPTAAFHALLADAAGIGLNLTPFGEPEMKAAPRLVVAARHGVGYDSVDVPALTRHGVPLMVTGTANSPTVAEQALAFMLALAKRVLPMDRVVRDLRWADRLAAGLPEDLFGKTVVVVGFGRTGSRLAKMCRAMEMDVVAVDPYVDARTIEAAGCTKSAALDDALPKADFVSIHCPRNAETTNMFDARRLRLMKPTAYLVNTARGGIIDEGALYEALRGGTIRAAGIDVLDREPAVTPHPLFTLDNILFAPHMAGVTRESMDRMAVATMQNILDVIDGKPVRANVVNPEVLDRQRRAG